MAKQDDIFLEKEGNNWYKRNEASFNAEKATYDWPLYLLKQFNIQPKKVVEVGCSGGWRLEWLKQSFDCECTGVEPSAVAIEAGQKANPNIRFVQGTAAKPNVEGKFDLVIVNFVLHWVDREMLFASLASIDSLVADNGFLIIGDFAPDFPAKNYYHHLPEENIFTYKQDYSQLFVDSILYTKIGSVTSGSLSKTLIPDISSDERALWTLLRKSKQGFYVDTTQHHKYT